MIYGSKYSHQRYCDSFRHNRVISFRLSILVGRIFLCLLPDRYRYSLFIFKMRMSVCSANRWSDFVCARLIDNKLQFIQYNRHINYIILQQIWTEVFNMHFHLSEIYSKYSPLHRQTIDIRNLTAIQLKNIRPSTTMTFL